MILLSHEVKLKLQELVKAEAKRQAAWTSSISSRESRYDSDFELHVVVRELIACLPPEVMAGLTDESNRS